MIMDKKTKDLFEKLCKKIFKFLEDEFNFKLVNSEQESCGIYITYQNPTTAIRISLEPRGGGVFILMHRLINGKIPKYPIFIEAETLLNSYYLDDLISLKAPSFKIEQQVEKISNHNEIERILVQYANALKHYAKDILKGDFQVFDLLGRIVKKRAEGLKKRQ